MSYHSLEDRLVKNLVLKGNLEGKDNKDMFGNPQVLFKPAFRKPVEASAEELQQNPRSRSAKLRIASKL
jgi:16S rRNA (cytosine1402-N4)-methyltransferase